MRFSTLNDDGTWTVWEGTAPAGDLFSNGTAQYRPLRGASFGGFYLPEQLAVDLPVDAKEVGQEVLPVGVVAVHPRARSMGDVTASEDTTGAKVWRFLRDVAVAVIAARAIAMLESPR